MSRGNAAVRRRRGGAHATSRRSATAHAPSLGRERPRRLRLRRDVARFYAVTLLIMFYGSAVALLLVAGGWAALLTEGVTAGTAESTAADGAEQEEGLGAPADISITAEHLGDLRVSIEAQVTMNAPKDPLGGAKVEAYVDMVQMPGAHTQGPLELAEERPGVYTTETTVPMMGDYDIRVQMNDPGLPVHAEATEVVSVGVLESDQ